MDLQDLRNLGYGMCGGLGIRGAIGNVEEVEEELSEHPLGFSLSTFFSRFAMRASEKFELRRPDTNSPREPRL